MIVIDLPSLQSIQLGYDALYGNNESCSLIMRSIYIILKYNTYLDLPKLTEIKSGGSGYNFYYVHSVTLESI